MLTTYARIHLTGNVFNATVAVKARRLAHEPNSATANSGNIIV